jgi:spore maturation protein CgeB
MYIYEPLKKIFSNVIVYDYLRRRREIGIKAMNEEVIRLIRKENPKYVIWTSFYDDVLQSTLDVIRSQGVIVIGWFFDDEWRFNSYSKYWAPHLDYCVTNSYEALPKYQNVGTTAINIIPNTGIAIDRFESNIMEKYDVSFVGTVKFADRKHYLNELGRNNFNLQVFGEGSVGYVSFEQMLDIFSSSKINLNFSKGAYYSNMQIKGRVFQVCMAGGFLLTEYAPGIERYFEIDREIVCFKGEEELLVKVRYYLDHEQERRDIAKAGWERASSEYTSSQIVAKVFKQIEGDLATKLKNDHIYIHKIKMPIWIRRLPSQYHFQWLKMILEQNTQGDLFRESLSLCLGYNPLNIWAWFYYIASFSPSFLRPAFFNFYDFQKNLILIMRKNLHSIKFVLNIYRNVLKILRDREAI